MRSPFIRFLLLTALPIAVAHAQQPCNVHGYPVRDPAGRPITYAKDQLEAQRLAAPDLAAAGGGGAPGIALPQAAPQSASWAFFAFGSGIGAAGMQASTANGVLELVASMGAQGFGELRYWMILRYDSGTKSYGNEVFVSPVYPTGKGIKSLVVGEAFPTAGPEIVVGRADGVIEVWSQATRQLLLTITTSATGLNAITLADVDGDAKVDLVVVNGSTLYVYEVAGTLKWSLAGPSGTDVVAAQMDADPALEIATTSGHVVDAATKSVQWFWNNKFGFVLKAGDIDADGKAELIAADQWSWIWAYDVDKQLPKWSLPVNNTGAIELGDIDKDNTLELIVGEAQWGSITGYDATTLAKEWSISNPEHGTTDITFADFDADGKNEVFWGAGFSHTGKDILYAGDITAQQVRWQSVHLDGPFVGPALGDIDGDGIPEIVTCSTTSDSGYAGGRIVVIDTSTLVVKAISAPVTSSFSSSLGDLQLVNVDTDPQLEIALAASNAVIYDYASQAFTKAWELPPASSSAGYSTLRIGDYDGDAKLDVVLGSAQFVHIVDYLTKTERWKSFYVGGRVLSLAMSDSDLDGQIEIHALSADGNVYVFDAKTRTADAILSHPGVKYTAATVWEVSPGIGLPITGDAQGRLTLFVPSAGAYLRLGPLPFRTQAIDGLQALGTEPFLLTGSGGVLEIAVGVTNAWTSQAYGDKFGTTTVVLDSKRMIVSGGTFGLAGFGL